MYFCFMENFTYEEINERSFSNPHPWFHWVTEMKFKKLSESLKFEDRRQIF